MKRPPPYFPQSQLSPPDPHRYKKFKMTIALIVLGLLIVLGGAAVGIYYLIKAIMS